MTSNPGLVVPVDVVGFCVSEADEQEATGAFAGATVVYSQQTDSQTPAYLGSNVSRGMAAPAWKRLETGIHLHWALPDALTKAQVDETNTAVTFPAAPNRWLVTRLAINGSSVTATSWVIESDALSAAAPATGVGVTIPVQPGSSSQDYAYLGQSLPLASYTAGANLDGVRSFKAATGFELSAVSNGAPTFASFYPESRTAFGFVDPMTDISGVANLTYVVTGWFDSPDNDPSAISADLTASHTWTTEDPPAYTLYSGFIQDIAWDPNRDYVVGQENQRPISAQAAIGNTPIEALSAYFRALEHPDIPLFESLLNAFQEGLLDRFAAPQPGVLPKLAEALHDNQFQAVDAGLIYTIASTDTEGDEQEVTDLPLPLAEALNALNASAQAYQALANDALSFQWRMFADWYRYFQADKDNNAAIINHANDLYAAYTTPATGLQALVAAAQTALKGEAAKVEAIVAGTNLSLKPTPAPRYWQPTDPAVLLASPDLSFPARYGGDTRHSPDGVLLCRPTDQLVGAVEVGGTVVAGSTYAQACTLTSASLPYLADCQNLLVEACLLNTQLGAAVSGQTDAALTTALSQLLAGQPQTLWTISQGTAPSPVAAADWAGANPWMPLFLQWNVAFAPLLATSTAGGDLVDYPADFFTSNFTVDPGTGSFVSYTPSAGGITVDPATLTYSQTWSGQSILSATSANNLATTIEKDAPDKGDATLQAILTALQTTPTVVQPLSGFTASLLMQQQIVQLEIAVPQNAPFNSRSLTAETVEVVGPSYHVSPETAWFFNPVRAGWFTVSLQAIDVFGQRRNITLTSVAEAASMTAISGGQPLANVAYAAPRLAQPARLLFQWISAAADGLVEMNSHPATSPICGWLLPNHLDGGFFLYDAAGRPLGSLGLNGDQTRILWQSAPGDDATIGLSIAEALADVNPVFRDLAIGLSNAAPAWFLDFWKAVDQVHGGVSPEQLATNAGLSILIGRPVAVAQTALRLDLQGRPALNQGWDCLGDDWTDTDNGTCTVQFPVVLGDIDKLDDGLIGYFTAPAGAYDLTTFYTEGASPGATAGVVQPTQDTLLLTPSPALDDPEPPTPETSSLQLLMLVDPRAKVHATMGILPTQSLQIPPDLAADALSILEMSFPVTPILRPASKLALPVPREAGYSVSFVEEVVQGGQSTWETLPDISPPTSGAVWDYTPQVLTEGWLRLNPNVLAFDLLNAAGKALVDAGATQAMTLRITNNKPASVTFSPGVIVPEGGRQQGAIVYLHFGALVDQADVPSMVLSAAGWTFQAMNDATYGQYWAATPTASVTLGAGQSVSFAIAGLKASASGIQAQIYADYYAIDGVADGVFVDLVTIQQPGA